MDWLHWGFDETSLDGVATLNQWCRNVEDNEAVVLTIECAGLLPGSTSAQVTKHVKATWERGAKVVAMVRAELGDSADDLVPVVHGGVHLSKLNGSMHDTCNTANLELHYMCYIHVNALVWRLVYKELRAVTNDQTLNLNPLEVNDLNDYLWDVGTLLTSTDALDILEVLLQRPELSYICTPH